MEIIKTVLLHGEVNMMAVFNKMGIIIKTMI